MRKMIYFIFCFSIFYFHTEVLGNDFGYICYSTKNIGDDIQAIAAKRFLPEKSIPIDREFISQFQHNSKVYTLLNGWYMNNKKKYRNIQNLKPPKKIWPPSSEIDPLLISMHFTKDFIPDVLSQKSKEYLIKHGPVGARDYFTLQLLQNNNIPSYFSGCITLTLENSCEKRSDIIYAVDIDSDCIDFIKSKTKCNIEFITHKFNKKFCTNEERLADAEELLEKYRSAKCVITSRLHCAMPCLAFETPVLLINTQKDQYRFDGLKELVRNCSKKEFLNDLVDFNFDEPTENPKLYIPIRENLIKTVTDWVVSKNTQSSIK